MIRTGLWVTTQAVALAAVTGTALAVIVARANPAPWPPRLQSAPPGLVLSEAITPLIGGGPCLLDVETGRLGEITLPRGSSLALASLSPWEERGRRQVVGVGWNRGEPGQADSSSDVSIVRLELPGGEVLDRVNLSRDPLPNSAPCWLPGTLAGVLYPGSNGRIYRLDFETAGPGGDVGRATEIRPREVPWPFSVAPGAEVVVSEMSWADGSGADHRLIASLRIRRKGVRGSLDWQVWWLQLDQGGTSVVDAGRLLETATADQRTVRRFPTLIRDPGGAPTLAYLAKMPEQSGYDLRLVPLRSDPGSDALHARDDEARVLARDCLPAPFVVKPEGPYVAVVRLAGRSVKAERLRFGADAVLLTTGPIGQPAGRGDLSGGARLSGLGTDSGPPGVPGPVARPRANLDAREMSGNISPESGWKAGRPILPIANPGRPPSEKDTACAPQESRARRHGAASFRSGTRSRPFSDPRRKRRGPAPRESADPSVAGRRLVRRAGLA